MPGAHAHNLPVTGCPPSITLLLHRLPLPSPQRSTGNANWPPSVKPTNWAPTLISKVPPRLAFEIRNLTNEDGTWEAARGAIAHNLIAKWNAARRDVLRLTLSQKFASGAVWQMLLDTGDAALIEDSKPTDSPSAVNVNDKAVTANQRL